MNRLRAVWWFTAAFFLAIAAYAYFGWHLGLVPEALRPLARTALWGGAAVGFVLIVHPLQPWRWLGLLPIRGRIVLIACGSFAVVFGLQALASQFVFGPTHRLSSLTVTALALSGVGVFVEELVFRGVIQTVLVEAMGTLAGVLIASALFLAVHVPGWLILDIVPPPTQIVGVFGVGLVCGALRVWSGSLWPSVFAHLANNLGVLV
ncbi:MAG: CPBP family intramembrane glutamic endopeptidase [Caulobacterales bacterium]|jgi:membrane protease YdiL (CAAX protease family)